MEQVVRSLTDRGASGYKEFSMSLCNSQTLAAVLFRQSKSKKTITLSRISSNGNGQRSSLIVGFTALGKRFSVVYELQSVGKFRITFETNNSSEWRVQSTSECRKILGRERNTEQQ
jgi:hypothetical protein